MLSATQALTVIAEIDPARRDDLVARLREIAANLAGNAMFRPPELPDTHFMRFVIIDDGAGQLPALLAWESNHDGYGEDYLAAVARAAPGIDRVFECCRDYPRRGTADVTAWTSWMQARSLRAAAFYTGYRGVSRTQVVNDGAIHDALRTVVDCRRGELDELPASEIQRRLDEAVREDHPKLDGSPQDEEEWRWLIGKILAIAAAAVLLPLALVIVVPWLVMLRRRERADSAPAYGRPVHDDDHFQREEDRFTQNQLTHLVDIKPGRFRLFTLWVVLTVIDVLARVYAVRGELGGITSIHFARWVILRDPQPRRAGARRHRLLFFSNYDGSWESYLGEFIDRAASGLTAVWSNTVDFPPTRFLLGEGARDEEAFKQWTRDHQIASQVWWTGIPDSTVQNVRDDIWIRRRLRRPLGDDEVRAWLQEL
jgi:hypothetical protein